jgi:hypothetical protein
MMPPEDKWCWLAEAARMYTLMIESWMAFAQANYGDGEWACILGNEGGNSNGESYDPELGAKLRDTLFHPSGMWCGMNPGKKLEDEANKWMVLHGLEPQMAFKETLSGANVNGHLGPFFRALKERSKYGMLILVGPHHLNGTVEHVIGPHHFIRVSSTKSWEEAEQTTEKVLNRWERGTVCLFASGMGSNLVIRDLWKTVIGDGILLDIGAILDPYAGVFSRKGYLKESFQNEAMQRNLA